MKVFTLMLAAGMVVASQVRCLSQCKEKVSKSNNQTMRYQDIPLLGKDQYFTLSRTGDEKIFTYCNESVALVFHVPMFTEIRFTSPRGNFSLFATTSDRTHFNKSFTLSCPLTISELEKMRGTVQIEIVFPEEKKVYRISESSKNQLDEALACVF